MANCHTLENATGRETLSRPIQFSQVALLALVLLALALRLYRLAAQDIWGDEAFSIFLSGQTLPQVLAGGADTHPPFYPLLLFFWLRVVGDPSPVSGAFAARALSALIGVLIVPLIFVLGKRIARARVAWFAAILATVSPLLIYYSQETRMYELVTVLMCASCLTLIPFQQKKEDERGEMKEERGTPKAGMYFLSTLLAMYTHYSAFFVWIAQNVWVAWEWLGVSLRGAVCATKQSPRGGLEIASQKTLAMTRGDGIASQKPLAMTRGDGVASQKPLAMTRGDGVASQKPLATLAPHASAGVTMPIRRWIILQLALVAIYVPWIIAQSGFLSGKSSARFDEWSWRGVEMIFGKTLLAFSAGLTVEPPLAQMIAFAFLILVALGIVFGKSPLPALYFLVPVVIAFLINPIMPFFFERYVLVALPGFYLTAALGLDVVARRARSLAIAAGAMLVALALVSLSPYYFNDAYAKGKYGQMMAFISTHAQSGDALILNNPLQKPLYRYYQPRDLPAYFLPDGVPLEDPSTRAQLEQITRTHARVWLVQFGNPAEYDPTTYLPRYLGAHAHKSFQQGFVDAALSLYLLPAIPEPALKPIRARLGETIELRGYRLDRDDIAPNEGLRLTLEWRAAARSEKSHKVFVHLIGGYNPATASPVWAQMDGEPVGGTRATNQWQVGDTIEDRYGLVLPDDIPPGEYILEVGMYDPATGARLAVTDENGSRVVDDRVILTAVKVTAR